MEQFIDRIGTVRNERRNALARIVDAVFEIIAVEGNGIFDLVSRLGETVGDAQARFVNAQHDITAAC